MESRETDAALVALARDGDRHAGQILLSRYYPMLVSRCRRMLRDPILAEDAAQDAAVQAMLNLDRLRQPEKFGPWLSGIGHNVCRRWLQHRARTAWPDDRLLGGDVLSDLEDASADPGELFETDELRSAILQAVDELPPGQRAAVRLVHLDGLSIGEAATSLQIATTAIKSRLFKARRTLRRRLRETWLEERMMTTEDKWVNFRVKDVRRAAESEEGTIRRHSLILEEIGGQARQAIWGIAPHAAEAIAIQLVGVDVPLPVPYALATQVLDATGGTLREARIPRVESGIGIDGPVGERVIECRMSDAINLALVSNLPIRYAADWLTDADEDSDAQRQSITDRLYAAGTEGPAEIAAELVEQFARATKP